MGSKAVAYEELRQRTIEENRMRMEELGLFKISSTFRKAPRKWAKKISLEARKSTRAANLPKVDYNENRRRSVSLAEIASHRRVNLADIASRRRSGRATNRPNYKEPCSDSELPDDGVDAKLPKQKYISPDAKAEALERARCFETVHPSFVKVMLKSHTSGGFWLGLPSDFCKTHFAKDGIVTLEDEDKLEWDCVYLHHKHGLSGGWRGFSLDHDLDDGDVLVFELVASNRYKVCITKASSTGECKTLQDTSAEKKSYQYVCRGPSNGYTVACKALKQGSQRVFDESHDFGVSTQDASQSEDLKRADSEEEMNEDVGLQNLKEEDSQDGMKGLKFDALEAFTINAFDDLGPREEKKELSEINDLVMPKREPSESTQDQYFRSSTALAVEDVSLSHVKWRNDRPSNKKLKRKQSLLPGVRLRPGPALFRTRKPSYNRNSKCKNP